MTKHRPGIRLRFTAYLQHVLCGRPWATLRGFGFSSIKFRGYHHRAAVRIKCHNRYKKLLHTVSKQWSLPFLFCPLPLSLVSSESAVMDFSTDLPPPGPVELQKLHPHSTSISSQPYSQISQCWKLPQLKRPKPWNSLLLIILASPHVHFYLIKYLSCQPTIHPLPTFWDQGLTPTYLPFILLPRPDPTPGISASSLASILESLNSLISCWNCLDTL